MSDKSIFNKSNGAGKGDVPRPLSISKKEYEKRWEKIFGKKKKGKKQCGNYLKIRTSTTKRILLDFYPLH